MLVEIAVADRNDDYEDDYGDDRSSQIPPESLTGRAEQTEPLVVRSELVELIAIWRLIGQVGSLACHPRLVLLLASYRAPEYSEFGLRVPTPYSVDFIVLEGVVEAPLLDRTAPTDCFGLGGRTTLLDVEDLRVGTQALSGGEPLVLFDRGTDGRKTHGRTTLLTSTIP
jgi:hypothetical protein